MDDQFDSAEFYDACDSEVYTATTPEEAVEAWLDFWMEPGCDVAALIREHAPCEVIAYRREVVSDEWIRSEAEWLFDRVSERFEEDFGNPDADPCHADADLDACMPAMMAAVRQLVTRGKVWRCERVATRVLNAEQIEAMMREYNPEWFEKDGGG